VGQHGRRARGIVLVYGELDVQKGISQDKCHLIFNKRESGGIMKLVASQSTFVRVSTVSTFAVVASMKMKVEQEGWFVGVDSRPFRRFTVLYSPMVNECGLTKKCKLKKKENSSILRVLSEPLKLKRRSQKIFPRLSVLCSSYR